MRKKVVIVLLGSMILPATVWAQYKPYNRQNEKGYVFDGHKLEHVLVKPYAGDGDTQTKIEKNADTGHWEVKQEGTYLSKNITVAKKNAANQEDYDDQVVYLYNPAAGLFLNCSGTWGTEAVGLYPGFGLAFNIVDPSGSSDLTDANFGDGWEASGKWGLGFYSESTNQGHYLSRDGDKIAGEPVFQDAEGNNINKIRFYTDRGNAGNNELRCNIGSGWSGAEANHIFTWHLEKVNKGDNNLNVYRLYQYIRNNGADNGIGPDRQNLPPQYFYKHYVKFEEINPFNENPYFALTTARANEVVWEGGESSHHKYVMKDGTEGYNEENANHIITEDENSADVDSYADAAFYEWQIITRRDLKEKFLLDFDDPYATKPERGNANFNIENPDFSRPLKSTIATSDAISWTAEEGAYDYISAVYDNAPYGRYAYLHPEKTGEFTQVFEPYQFGLFDVEVQGFTLKAHGGNLPTAKLWVTTEDATKIGYTGEVTFDQISDEDKKDLYQRIGDIARESLSNEWYWKYQVDIGGRGVADYRIFKYSGFNPNPENDGYDNEHNRWDIWQPGFISVRADNGWGHPDNFNAKALYRITYVDEFGHVCKGIYINGQTLRPDSKLGPWEGTYDENGEDYVYSWEVNGTGWKNEQKGKPYATVHVNVGDKVEFGPHIGTTGAEDNDDRFQWWTPSGDGTHNRSLTINNVTYDDAGDYILTYHDKTGKDDPDNKWNAVCYRLIVDTPLGLGDDELTPPEAGYVNINGTGLPYAIGDGQGVSHELGNGDPGDFTAEVGGIKGFQNAIAATDRIFLDRGIGSFLYDVNNNKKYYKTVSFYLPEGAGATLDDVTVHLKAEDISNPLKDIVAIDNARLTYRGESPYILDDNNVINTNKSFSTGNSRIPVYMNRQFDKDAWNAFVCPLPLNGQQVVDAFGANVQISEINLKGLDPNYPLRIVFDSKTFNVSDAQVIAPGHFYLVKPSALEYQSVAQVNIERDGGGNITAIDAVSYKSNEGNLIVDGHDIGKGHFTYLGTHDLRLPGADGEGTGDELAIPTKKDGDKVVVDTDAFNDYNPYGEGGKYPTSYPQGVTVKTPGVTPYSEFFAEFYPANTGKVHNSIKLVGSYLPMTFEKRENTYIFRNKDQNTQLVHLASSGGTGAPTGLKGFRFYIQDIETVQAPAGQAKPFTFVIDGVEDGNESSGISNAVIGEDTTGDIYTIAGQKVTGTLGKGVYVKNGKKFLVK